MTADAYETFPDNNFLIISVYSRPMAYRA